MFVTWSTVRTYSEGVFDIWFACPHCGYQSWARARGVGEGSDTGIQGSASRAHAELQARVMSEHAAMRAVHGSPCPRCSRHHPEVVRWAQQADRQERKLAITRRVARGLVALGIASVIVFVACAIAWRPSLETLVAFGLVALSPLVVGRALLANARPMHGRWILHEHRPPGVTFQAEAIPPMPGSESASS